MLYRLGDREPQLSADGSVFVAHNASVIGTVELRANVGIWFNAVLRGDNDPITIGEDSNIQDACVLHTDEGSPLIVGRGVTVGHKVMLHGCRIADNCLIGINAVVLNDARIGPNCLIGANTLVPERREIPEGSLVLGSPGRVVRQLTEAEIEMIRESARHYVANARRYQEQFAPLD